MAARMAPPSPTGTAAQPRGRRPTRSRRGRVPPRLHEYEVHEREVPPKGVRHDFTRSGHDLPRA
jgi:hypothetical protein